MAVYVCSDLHGQKDLFAQILGFIGLEDTIYFLGDAADRGPHGWEMIKMIMIDERFIYLKGNHEDMLVTAAKDYYKYSAFTHNYNLLRSNGGKVTFFDMINDECGQEWINRIEKLPTHKTYVNAAGQIIFLSHAGFTPLPNEHGDIEIPCDQELILNRRHNLDFFPPESDAIVVHGHTPIQCMVDDLRYDPIVKNYQTGPLWYYNNKKVCIDNAAFHTGVAFLMNLDTFEYHTFVNTMERT